MEKREAARRISEFRLQVWRANGLRRVGRKVDQRGAVMLALMAIRVF